jgi:plastocyanin
MGQVALVGLLAVLALPSSGSALSAVFVSLTPTGPSPAVLTIPAGLYPVWTNQDTVTHTVTFANGCSIQVAPGGYGQCTNGFSGVVGDYPYTVDGTAQASIVVTAEGRTVTLEARRHTIARGSELLLHGELAVAQMSPPALSGPRQPVIVLARPDGRRSFHRIAVVTAKPHRWRGGSFANVHSVWRLRVRPRASTTYVVEANSQPAGGQYWQRARSGPFRVRVGR